jgi:hypothetical protein
LAITLIREGRPLSVSDTSDGQNARWLPPADAAAILGISINTLRLRMSRQSVDTRVNGDGQVVVPIPYDLTEYVRHGFAIPEALAEEPPKLSFASKTGRLAAPRPNPKLTPPEAGTTDQVEPTGVQQDNVHAVIAELGKRHSAEIDRLVISHQREVDRLMAMHQASTTMLADNKEFLLNVISTMSGDG